MEIHREFQAWAVAQGVNILGIAAYRFPGRGLGIIAEKELEHCLAKWILTVKKAGDIIVTVPNTALRTVRTVPKSISRSIGDITVHGLLAAELAMETSEARRIWRAVLPKKEDMEESIPFLWHPSLQALLPAACLLLVENQRKKMNLDWSAVHKAFPTLSYDSYLYNWFIVNSRTFYYTSPKIKPKRPVNRDDCLALAPFADYFNHADVGSEVTFSPSGYQIRTDRHVAKGEEIYISYGNHSNDFLLAEYGFILDENRWDEISIDDILLPLFSGELKQGLKEAGFLGNFVLDREAVCYRTQVALRLLCMPPNKWQRLTSNGLDIEDEHQAAVNQILSKSLKAYLVIAHEKLERVEMLTCGLSSQREMLKKRWEQICLILRNAISRSET